MNASCGAPPSSLSESPRAPFRRRREPRSRAAAGSSPSAELRSPSPEALAGAHPFPRPGELLDHAFDVGGQAQLEQEGKSARLGLAHDPLVAETAIATQQGWPEVARQPIEQRPQARRAVLGGMFVAGTDVDIENKTRRGHRIGVIAMARTPRLLGIVAQDRAFLMAVKRLDRRIDVENPGLGEQRLHAILKVLT